MTGQVSDFRLRNLSEIADGAVGANLPISYSPLEVWPDTPIRGLQHGVSGPSTLIDEALLSCSVLLGDSNEKFLECVTVQCILHIHLVTLLL